MTCYSFESFLWCIISLVTSAPPQYLRGRRPIRYERVAPETASAPPHCRGRTAPIVVGADLRGGPLSIAGSPLLRPPLLRRWRAALCITRALLFYRKRPDPLLFCGLFLW